MWKEMPDDFSGCAMSDGDAVVVKLHQKRYGYRLEGTGFVRLTSLRLKKAV